MTELDETTCGSLCQHPSCWTSQRRQEIGKPRILPPTDSNTSNSEYEIDLPVQSICNLLSDYGNCISDYHQEAPGECVTHQWYTGYSGSTHRVPTYNSQRKLSISSAKRSSIFKPGYNEIKDYLPRLFEAKDIFGRTNFSNDRVELCSSRKQFYVWVPNPQKNLEKLKRNSLGDVTSKSILMKDLTECMMPQEIGQKRQNSVLKKHTPTKLRPMRLSTNRKNVRRSNTVPFDVIVQPEGYSSTKRKVYSAFLEHSCDNEQAMDNIGNFTDRQELSENFKEQFGQVSQSRPIVDTDNGQVLHDSELLNVLARQKTMNSNLNGSFYRYRLPSITDEGRNGEFVSSQHMPDYPFRLTSVSLGLSELPAGVQTTKPFSYRKHGLDLSLGPVISLSSSDQNAYNKDDPDHNTTVKASGPSTQYLHSDSNKHVEQETAVSSTLATHIVAPSAATTSRLLEISLPQEHRPVLSEVSADTIFPATASEPAPLARSDRQWLISRDMNEPGQIDQANKKLLDVKITAESPAPPPPSPEPRVITHSNESPVSNERDASVFPIEQVK